MKFKLSLAELFIEQILELSAEAQIERRRVNKSSAAFQSLSGAIVAYGNALALLAAFRELEALDATPGFQWDFRDCAVGLTH